MNEPLASIVITSRDRPGFIDRAVRSALDQTVQDIEVIVVDDGSATPVVLEATDPRLRCVREDPSVGLSAARNAGLALARAPWITFLDDDDQLLPQMVERSLVAAEGSSLPPPVGVISDIATVDEAGTVLEISRAAAIRRGSDHFSSHTKYKNSLMVPMDVLRSIGGWDPAMESWEHGDLLLRLTPHCSIEALSEVTYLRTDHRGPRLTTDHRMAAEALDYMLRKHRDRFLADRRLHARYLAEMSKNHLKAGEWVPALRSATRSLLRDPTRRHALRQWVGTLLGPSRRLLLASDHAGTEGT